MLGIGPRSIVSRPPLWLLLSGSAAAQAAALNGAQTLLDGETDGLAFDFTDQSAYIVDTGTPANDYDSTGIVSSGDLVGPSGKLTYTSPSNKLTMQSDGFIKYQAHNLYLNSAAPANQSITVISGASYAVTITGTVSVTASGAATGTWTAGTNTFTAATTTLTLGSTSGSGTVHVRRTPSNDDYIETAGAAKYTLPIEYDTSGNCLGLLVEEARTNLCLQNTNLSTTWTTFQTTISANAATAPDGLTTADKIVVDSGLTGSVRQSITISSATSYAVSAYLKYEDAGAEWAKVYFSSSSAHYCSFHLTGSGTVGTAVNCTGSIKSVGNGWYRCTIVFTSDGTGGANAFRIFPSSADDTNLTGDGTSGTLVWGAQVEAGSFPTSPIITYGATATRAADNISIATSAFPRSDTAESIYCEFSALGYTAGGGFVWVIDGSGGDHDLLLNSTNARARMSADGSATAFASPVAGTTYKVSAAMAANDLATSADGATVSTDTSATYRTDDTQFCIGARAGSVQLNGHIKALSYVPRRKSDAELQTETT